jgi:hypothetical protein
MKLLASAAKAAVAMEAKGERKGKGAERHGCGSFTGRLLDLSSR